MVKVIKRDGQLEDFDLKKIARVLQVAGLDKEAADLLSNRVSAWVDRNYQDSVSSLEIKDKVLEELKLVNSYIADLFQWYEKTKEI